MFALLSIGVRAAPASILLYGPPGTGKTQLAKAFAGEAQAAFMSIGPSDVLSKFVGESVQSIKTLFQEAREKAKRMESRCAVVFFDEIDALGMSRSSGGSENEGLMSVDAVVWKEIYQQTRVYACQSRGVSELQPLWSRMPYYRRGL